MYHNIYELKKKKKKKKNTARITQLRLNCCQKEKDVYCVQMV